MTLTMHPGALFVPSSIVSNQEEDFIALWQKLPACFSHFFATTKQKFHYSHESLMRLYWKLSHSFACFPSCGANAKIKSNCHSRVRPHLWSDCGFLQEKRGMWKYV